ncbi:MAG TPA: rhomboid family intramembrane serine protease [Solirubrobacteraceae bacterium]|nr:rhomboid family intramembrane serine protease [Solirubrobacteraceae bacterium]
MPSSADLFVVCKKCGSEVSPYITECPYCGHRLRRRAPKLPRERLGGARRGLLSKSPLARLSREGSPTAYSDRPPYVALALVAASAVVWIAMQGGYLHTEKLIVAGPLHGDWWRPLSSAFLYGRGFSAGMAMFATLLAVAVFGGLLERRNGSPLVLFLFFAAEIAGVLAAEAVYPFAVVTGANAAALALLAAWAGPNLLAARAGEYYEADLLGAGAFALVLLALPFARGEMSWLAGVTGGVLGLMVGLGLARVRAL